MAARDFRAWQYTSDAAHGGDIFSRGADKFITDQVGASTNPKVGGAAEPSPSTHASMPRNLKPRGVYVSEASTGFHAFVVVYATDADLWTGAETAVNVRDAGGTSHTCEVYGQRGEKFRRRRPGV